MPLRSFIWLSWSILVLLGMAQGAGCRSFSVPEEPPRSTPGKPLWSDVLLREHLRFFNGPDVQERVTGTVGYATAASYVAARMAEFGLQPALGSEAQVIYPVSFNEIQAATLTRVRANADTLVFYPGVDFLPDGRSDSGRIDISVLVMGPSSRAEAVGVFASPGVALVMAARAATTDSLEALRDAGVRVVLTVGRLVPRPAPHPVRGLLVVQVLPETVLRLMGASGVNLEAQLNRVERVTFPLPRPVRLHVETQALPFSGALNVLGFVSGKHPARARELVIVCSDLDAVGTFAGVPTLDASHLGVGTTALLELARHYSLFARFSTVPERTLLFAVFSGARQGYAGLRAYLRHPLWALSRTRAVVYMGLDAADEPTVRALVEANGLALYVIPPMLDTLGGGAAMLMPEQRPPRRRTLRPGSQEESRVDLPRVSDLLVAGITDARRMAEATHTMLLREAVAGPGSFPLRADTLRIPKTNE